MSKTILAETDGFTPVIDMVVADTSITTAVVFGRIWRFCQMEDGVCTASLEKIAKDIGMDRSTVMRHAKDLCENGYLKDLTPDMRYKPHTYADTGKAGLHIEVQAKTKAPKSVAHSNGVLHTATRVLHTATESPKSVAQSQLKIDSKIDSKIQPTIPEKKGDLVDGVLAYSQDPKAKALFAIQDRFNNLFRLNADFENSKKWRGLDKWLLRKEKAEESIERFAGWYLSDAFRKKLVIHLTAEKVKEAWPQAFMDGDSLPASSQDGLKAATAAYAENLRNTPRMTPEQLAKINAEHEQRKKRQEQT